MRRAVVFIALSLAAGCSNNPTNVLVRALDRPTAVDFVCYGQPLEPAYGNVVVNPATGEIEAVTSDIDSDATPINRPQPSSACNPSTREIEYEAFQQRIREETGLPDSEIPSRTEVEGAALGAFPPDVFGFILESDAGAVALARFGVAPVVQDTDPLTPDRNAISVGELPVALATDASGCHVTVANAGSCDLASVNVSSALATVLESGTSVEVSRLQMKNLFGQRLAVVPQAIARSPVQKELGEPCPDDAEGLVYVALPGCSLVAAIDAGTGAMQAGVSFAGSVPTVVDGSFSCTPECGAGNANLAGDDPAGLQPSVVSVTRDDQLLIAASNSNVIAIVNLDEDGLPIAGQAFTVALEGDVGVTDIAATGPVNVGGDSGVFGAGVVGEREYLYAIATDRSIRVVDIGSLSECDTQIDPRFVRNINSPGLLACLPVDPNDAFERRVGARGPGIRLPAGVVPTALQPFVQTLDARRGGQGVQFLQIDGGTIVGHFMLVTGSNGSIYIVNVDDDLYPDFGTLVDDQVYMSLALPHQLRDSFVSRGGLRGNCRQLDQMEVNAQGPRGRDFVQTFDGQIVSRANIELLPNTATVGCVMGSDPGEGIPEDDVSVIDDVPELSFVAPLATRQWGFPDLASVIDERWSLRYEGLLSRDDGIVPVDGPIARLGGFSRDGGAVVLRDNASHFVAAGVEAYDIVNLLGCASNFDCGPSEQCVFSPEAPAGVTNGLCAAEEVADMIAAACRDILVTSRRFTAVDSRADRLTLVPRREVLEVTPVDGCASDAQCEEFAAVAQRLNGDVPLEDAPPLTEEELEAIRGQYACEADPSRRPGRNWCALRCDDSPDENGFPIDPCAAGQACVDNRCVQAVLPPAECLESLQAYSLAAGESFVAVSARATSAAGRESPIVGRTATGFLHPLIVDPAPDSNACIVDPDASPLLRGRIRPYDLAECPQEVDELEPAAPNPCLVSDFENEILVTDGAEPTIELETRRAVRFSNPIFTFHLLLPENVLETGEGAVEYSVLHPGLGVTFAIEGGFSAFRALNSGLVRRPASMRIGPTGRIYVVDEGNFGLPVNARGQVLVITPGFARDENNLLELLSFGQILFLR